MGGSDSESDKRSTMSDISVDDPDTDPDYISELLAGSSRTRRKRANSDVYVGHIAPHIEGSNMSVTMPNDDASEMESNDSTGSNPGARAKQPRTRVRNTENWKRAQNKKKRLPDREYKTRVVSDGKIYSCTVKDDVSLVLDARGNSTPGNKVDATDVVNHIKSFPAYSSHYTRAHNPNRK
ncbi:hypothetical protein PR048_019710 [Dryococelus australis]|uniref:Uncharacterized protein n=1 Tax=Dryococelus australis TaxID=614101 RepID=A0ABQ9H479_9NEOP|nr:hypothetical protein PR048_019710 [Dryococelus australis]